jgi:hypothetical protein
LMRRVFGLDVLACPPCGHTMRLIARIEQAEVIRRIHGHVGDPIEVPAPVPARPPSSQAFEYAAGIAARPDEPEAASRRLLQPVADDAL